MRNPLQKLRHALYGLSVSRKILVISAVSSLVTLTLFCSIFLYREWQAFKERKVANISSLAEIMANNSVASLRFNDPYVAKQYVDSLQSEKDIESVCLYDAQGEIFAFFAESPNFEPFPAPSFTGERWEDDRLLYARSILLDGRHLGTVLLEMNTASFRTSALGSLYLALLLFAGGLTITIILAARMQRLITRPVDELVKVTRDLTEAEDYTQRAQKLFNDEIGSLVDSFNRMLDAISARDASLKEINSSLEGLVEERTQDLQARNAELKDAMEAARAASVAKSEFLATTSHELRTPLNPIIGYVEKIQREDPDGPNARELSLIRQSAEQLLRLIDDILDFSRIERGVLRLDQEKVDFRSLCRGIVNLLVPQARSKGLSLTYIDESEPSALEAGDCAITDEGRLRQVVLNLVSNAIKFTRSGSVTIRSKVKPVPDGSNSLSIEVQDTGIGIAAEDQHRLFQPFSQIDGTWTREFGGMGLGLAISRKIVMAMNGNISLESEKNVGSTFRVEIPVELAEADSPLPTLAETRASQEPPDEGAHVLLVEDEMVNRELMFALLTGLGHRVDVACNGLEAMERAKVEIYDFILLDISMPKMNGFETARALRALDNDNRQAPIVAMTAHVTSEDRERCFEAGMDDYLAKPISFSKLTSILARWLEKKPA